jgi:hypothetical protein
MYQTSDSVFAFSSLTLFACARDLELHTVRYVALLGADCHQILRRPKRGRVKLE